MSLEKIQKENPNLNIKNWFDIKDGYVYSNVMINQLTDIEFKNTDSVSNYTRSYTAQIVEREEEVDFDALLEKTLNKALEYVK
jgi:hypothetical protein